MMPRYAARRDLSEPGIVDALEKAGVLVYRKLPCDLLCRVKSDPPGILRALENKTPQGKAAKLKLRKDQQEQAEFCEETGTPYVMTPEQALHALGLI
jgi:hypothetical protein